MKARISAPEQRRVLAYKLPEHFAAPLRQAAEAFKAEVLLTEDSETPVGMILDGAAGEPAAEAPQETCLLIAGFDRGTLSGFVDALRECGVYIPLKAAYTPHNREWSFTQLIAELRREHEYMTGGAAKC